MYKEVGEILNSRSSGQPFSQKNLPLRCFYLWCFSAGLHKDHDMVTESWEWVAAFNERLCASIRVVEKFKTPHVKQNS